MLYIASPFSDASIQEYWSNDEMRFEENFFKLEALKPLQAEAEDCKKFINRSYLPNFKKGGSVSAHVLKEHGKAIRDLYINPKFIAELCKITKADLRICPDNDPHAYALYYYTETGDHIGYHYDTSYYKGATNDEFSIRSVPGSLIVFNGDKVWHAVTPLNSGEERIMITYEYVVDQRMNPIMRAFSNFKDAIARM